MQQPQSKNGATSADGASAASGGQPPPTGLSAVQFLLQQQQQQLLQQQQQIGSAFSQPQAQSNLSSTLGLYQQLIAQQLQQQQSQAQPEQLLAQQPQPQLQAPQQLPISALPLQFNTALHLQSTAAAPLSFPPGAGVPPHASPPATSAIGIGASSAFMVVPSQTQTQAGGNAAGLATALSQLLPGTAGTANPLSSLTQLMMPNQLALQHQQQQQQNQLVGLLQMLQQQQQQTTSQAPAGFTAQHNLLQQTQPLAAQPQSSIYQPAAFGTPTISQQQNLLAHFFLSNGGVAPTATTVTTAAPFSSGSGSRILPQISAADAQQQLSVLLANSVADGNQSLPPDQKQSELDESKALLEQLLLQRFRERQQQQQPQPQQENYLALQQPETSVSATPSSSLNALALAAAASKLSGVSEETPTILAAGGHTHSLAHIGSSLSAASLTYQTASGSVEARNVPPTQPTLVQSQPAQTRTQSLVFPSSAKASEKEVIAINFLRERALAASASSSSNCAEPQAQQFGATAKSLFTVGVDGGQSSSFSAVIATPTDGVVNVPSLQDKIGALTSVSRQPSSDRLLTNAESVQDHISRLISENEAIVEPNPVLLKRRPYHRQSTSNSITSQTSECTPGGSRDSPQLQQLQQLQQRHPTTRSHSLHEASLLNSLRLGGSLTSGQPIFRQQAGCLTGQQQPEKQHSQPHLKGLSSSIEQQQQNIVASTAQQQLLLHLQQQQHQQQQRLLAQQAQHQSNIAALVGGGMGVAPDVIVNGAGDCGRSSVPIGAVLGSSSNTAKPSSGSADASDSPNAAVRNIVAALDNVSVSASPTTSAAATPPQPMTAIRTRGSTDSPVLAHQLSSASLLSSGGGAKKRVLEAMESDPANVVIDVVSTDQPESATKIAKIKPSELHFLQQRLTQQLSQQQTAVQQKQLSAIVIPPQQQSIEQQGNVGINLSILQQLAQQQQQQHTEQQQWLLAVEEQQRRQQLRLQAEVQQQQATIEVSQPQSQLTATATNQVQEETLALLRLLQQHQLNAQQLSDVQLQQLATAVAGGKTTNSTASEVVETVSVALTTPAFSRAELQLQTSSATLPIVTAAEINQQPGKLPAAQKISQPSKDAICYAIAFVDSRVRSACPTDYHMPYMVTYVPADQLTNGDVDDNGKRQRVRNITTDTFVCLQCPRPTPQIGQASVYSHCWQAALTNAEEKVLLSLFLRACSATPKAVLRDSCLYAIATTTTGSLRTTHSSFWELPSKKRAITDNVIVEEFNGGTNITSSIPSNALAVEAKPTPSVLNNQTPTIRRSEELLPTASTSNESNKAVTTVNTNVRKTVAATFLTEKRPVRLAAIPLSKVKPIDGTEEVEAYVRGRGRGRYVCERCGIRCKKPSMLKKHLKSHTNIRPFTCITCNFSFKTKGNLTKHLFSKAHRRRLADDKGYDESVYHHHAYRAAAEELDREAAAEAAATVVSTKASDFALATTTIDSSKDEAEGELSEFSDDPRIMKLSLLESRFVNDEFEHNNDEDDDNDDDDDDDEDEDGFAEPAGPADNLPPPVSTAITSYRRFGQENILVERLTHTPPTLWMLCQEEDLTNFWPKPDTERGCNSAPPVALCLPHSASRRIRQREARAVRRRRTGLKNCSSTTLPEDNEKDAPTASAAEILAASESVPNFVEVSGFSDSPSAEPSNVGAFMLDNKATTAFSGQQTARPNELIAPLIPVAKTQTQTLAGQSAEPSTSATLLSKTTIDPNSDPTFLNISTNILDSFNALRSNGVPLSVLAAAGLLTGSQLQTLAQTQIQQIQRPTAQISMKTSATPARLDPSIVTQLGIELAGTSMGALTQQQQQQQQYLGFPVVNTSIASVAQLDSSLGTHILIRQPVALQQQQLHQQQQLQQQQQIQIMQQQQQLLSQLPSFTQQQLLSMTTSGVLPAVLQVQQQQPLSQEPDASIPSLEAFLAKESQGLQCDMCERKYHKESELILHRQTHLIERQQNAKSRGYQCAECRTTFKSKALLGRHMEAAHRDVAVNLDDDEQGSHIANGSTSNGVAPSTSNSNKPTTTIGNLYRNFVCVDCNLAFRTHGVLSKHLRSKNHVKTLVNVGRLPEDALQLIREQSHTLAAIDASDCEMARSSLLKAVKKLRAEATSNENSASSSTSAIAETTDHVPNGSSSMAELQKFLTNNGRTATIGISDTTAAVAPIAINGNSAIHHAGASVSLAFGIRRTADSAEPNGHLASGSVVSPSNDVAGTMTGTEPPFKRGRLAETVGAVLPAAVEPAGPSAASTYFQS